MLYEIELNLSHGHNIWNHNYSTCHRSPSYKRLYNWIFLNAIADNWLLVLQFNSTTSERIECLHSWSWTGKGKNGRFWRVHCAVWTIFMLIAIAPSRSRSKVIQSLTFHRHFCSMSTCGSALFHALKSFIIIFSQFLRLRQRNLLINSNKKVSF